MVLPASSVNMSDKIFVNKYISEVVPEDFPRNKPDDFLTYIDQLKYKRFMSDPDKYLEKAEVINFDMIHARCSQSTQQYSNRYYQTIHTSEVRKMSQMERKKAVGACLRSEWKDIFVDKNLTRSHFLENTD